MARPGPSGPGLPEGHMKREEFRQQVRVRQEFDIASMSFLTMASISLCVTAKTSELEGAADPESLQRAIDQSVNRLEQMLQFSDDPDPAPAALPTASYTRDNPQFTLEGMRKNILKLRWLEYEVDPEWSRFCEFSEKDIGGPWEQLGVIRRRPRPDKVFVNKQDFLMVKKSIAELYPGGLPVTVSEHIPRGIVIAMQNPMRRANIT